MQTENDLCSGFQSKHTGVNGVCCCGLYWEGTMPPHDAHQRPVRLDHILRRAQERAASRAVRDELQNTTVEQPSALDLLKNRVARSAA